MILPLFILFFVVITGSQCFFLSYDPNGTFIPWETQSVKRDDLLCPQDTCRSYENTLTTRVYKVGELYCCTCMAKATWEISGRSKILSIEYIQSDGSAVIIDDSEDNSAVSLLIHRNGFLTRLPSNICEISTLVKVDLSHNFITEISLLHCVTNIDTLDLSYNKISSLKPSDLRGLSHLRNINLSNCGLQYVEPFTLTDPSVHIFRMDLSNNSLLSFDISNMATEKIFCELNLQNNRIGDLINEGNFTIDSSKPYQGGFIDVNLNSFRKFIDVRKVFHISDMTLLGKLSKILLNLGVVDWPCDCHLIQLLDSFGPMTSAQWSIDPYARCKTPKILNGELIFELFRQKDRRLQFFRCYNLTKCPAECICYYQPFPDNKTVINCAGTVLTKVPSIVPPYNGLVLNYSNNSIGAFTAKPYLSRAVILDLSVNNLVELDPGAISQLDVNVILNISGNNIQRLPREMQKLDPCNIISDTIIINCGCTEIWLIDWLTNKDLSKCELKNMVLCSSNGMIKPLNTLSKTDLCSEMFWPPGVIYLTVILGLTFIIFSMCVYMFHVELYLMKRSIWKESSRSKVHGQYTYDVFISFDEENDNIRKWVLKVLDTKMRSMGYRTFIPCKDLMLGSNTEEDVLLNVKSCRHHLVILSHMYGIEQNSQVEWRYIWSDYKCTTNKQVIVLNFDHLDAFDCPIKHLQAFLRIGLFIDFTNTSKKLCTRISEIIGTPTFAWRDNMCNMRSRFSNNKIQTVTDFNIKI